jgi:hypothetical protein
VFKRVFYGINLLSNILEFPLFYGGVGRMFERFFGSKKFVITHVVSETISIENIADNTYLERAGNGDTIVNSVGNNVELKVKENGTLKVLGNIGSNCKIWKEGLGELIIDGDVADDLKLTVYGQGAVRFRQRPPESVIAEITNRTNAPIFCAGVRLESSHNNTAYLHHNLGRNRSSSNNYVSSRQDNFYTQTQPAHTSPQHQQQPTRAAPQPKPSVSEDDSKADNYTELTRKYIETYKEKIKSGKIKSIADQIRELALTEEEEPLFEQFIEPITGGYFDDVPVQYDERYYNLSTILELYTSCKPDPFSREPLCLANIQSARMLLNALEETIAKLKADRKKAAKQDVVMADATKDHLPKFSH